MPVVESCADWSSTDNRGTYVIYIYIYHGEEVYMVNIQPETEVWVVCRYIPEPKARGILFQTTDDRGRGVYVHHNTASST